MDRQFRGTFCKWRGCIEWVKGCQAHLEGYFILIMTLKSYLLTRVCLKMLVSHLGDPNSSTGLGHIFFSILMLGICSGEIWALEVAFWNASSKLVKMYNFSRTALLWCVLIRKNNSLSEDQFHFRWYNGCVRGWCQQMECFETRVWDWNLWENALDCHWSCAVTPT